MIEEDSYCIDILTQISANTLMTHLTALQQRLTETLTSFESRADRIARPKVHGNHEAIQKSPITSAPSSNRALLARTRHRVGVRLSGRELRVFNAF
nr:metal-sensing transcriptional repressor [Amycolatopsis palatopharyngis]